MPVSGLAYYVYPPKTFSQMAKDPAHVVFYILYVMLSCGFFSVFWMHFSGSSPKDIAKQLISQDMYILDNPKGTSIQTYLSRLIVPASFYGGITLGCLSIFADFMGAIGSGSGILMAMTIIYKFFEVITSEKGKGSTFIF